MLYCATHSFNVLTRTIATATFIVIMLTMSFKVLLTVATAILDVNLLPLTVATATFSVNMLTLMVANATINILHVTLTVATEAC